jgi:hypothetical protein
VSAIASTRAPNPVRFLDLVEQHVEVNLDERSRGDRFVLSLRRNDLGLGPMHGLGQRAQNSPSPYWGAQG